MFEKVLTANRGDRPPYGGAAAQPHCAVTAGHKGVFAPEIN
jgi:hypothetical protein